MVRWITQKPTVLIILIGIRGDKMAVEIKSGDSSDLVGVFPVGKGLRVTNVSSSGVEGFQSLPIAVTVTDVTAVNDDLIASLDVANYKFISFQLSRRQGRAPHFGNKLQIFPLESILEKFK